MKTASGFSRGRDAWEPHVFVTPRGLIEHLWLALLISSLSGVMALRGGWYVLLCTAVLVLFTRESSRSIMGTGTLCLLIGLAANTVTGRTLMEFATASSWWGEALAQPTLMLFVAHLGLVMGLSLIAVGIAHAYDSRAVDRNRVDSRVWERQTRQRRRVIREWAKHREVPEVLP